MNDIKVSIVVPVYNVEKYLRKCLESLCAQTLKDIEIICIDDGSTDNSGTILNEYKTRDRRIIVLSQENKGKSFAVNRAMKAAVGEYIGLVDPDDWVSANYYEALWKTAKSKNADISRACFMRVYSYGEEENRLNETIRFKAENAITLDVNDHSVVMWDAIYRRDFIFDNKLFLDESLKSSVDVPFTFKASILAKSIFP